MKKYIFVILISLFTFSCEEPIDVDLTDREARLVIDASFSILKNETNTTSETQGGIRLSLSTPFFDEEIPTVSNASIQITNLTDNTVLNFIESETLGYFIPENNLVFQPVLNTEYQLTVIYNDETYTATTQLIPTVPIDNLEQGDGVLFEGTEKEVVISYTDDVTRTDFYLFDLDFDLFLQSEDTFYQGQTFNFSYFYSEEDLKSDDEEGVDTDNSNQEITIQISGVDETYYNYFNLVLQQSQANGSPFQTIPALIKGNIINTTNEDNFPLGYFRISESYNASIILEDN